MNKKMTCKKLITNGLLFLLIVGLTFSIIFKGDNVNEIIKAIFLVKIKYVILAVLCGSCFICCEGINIGRTLKSLGYKCSYLTSIKYGLVGFFFSSVTPSASGGQPMQVYYMSKDKINLSHGTLALLIEVASYQLVNISLGILAFLYSFDFIKTLSLGVKILIAVGTFLNIVAFICILLALFSKKVVFLIMNLIVKLLFKLKIKKAEKFKIKVLKEIEIYHSSSTYITQNKKLMIKIIITTTIQMVALHSITFFIYCAFGMEGFSYLTVLSLQAVLFIAASSIPLPGAVGVSEGAFMSLFSKIFPVNILGSAMVLSRGISFYLFVLISGIGLIIIQILNNHNAAKDSN